MRVRVAGDERRHAQRRREIAQRGVAPRVAALVRTLQLDEEVLASEDIGEPRRRVRVANGEPVPRAAGETDEPVVQLLEQRRLERRRQRLASLLRPRPRMRRREQPAEVRVPLLRLDEEREMRPAVECHFRAGDRPDAESLRRVRELERAVDAVVVGERERLVAELRRPGSELLRLRGPVEERVGAVGVQLDVAHPQFYTNIRSCTTLSSNETYGPAIAERAFPVVFAVHVSETAAFYERLGFEPHFQLPPEGEPGYVGLRRGDYEVAVVASSWPDEQYGAPVGDGVRFELFVYVVGVDKLVEELRAEGVTVLREAADMAWGERVAYVTDPDGNPVALAQSA